MTAYRFCRSDDVPLLVEAFARCNVGPDARPWRLTVDDMKRLAREVDLWTSSCMVAFAGADPVGVLIAAKREPIANLVLHVAVHPDHRRRGHGRHMMTSLSRKMAILEPTLMLAEVPGEDVAARGFLEACGFAETETLEDCIHDGPPATAGALPDLAGSVDPEEIVASAEVAAVPELDRCWQRGPRTIRNLRQRVRGVGIATDRGFEACLIYRPPPDADNPLPFLARPPRSSLDADPESASAACEILAIGGRRPVPALLGPVLTYAAGESGRSLYLPRVHPAEPLADRLDDHGFRTTGGTTLRFQADAARS